MPRTIYKERVKFVLFQDVHQRWITIAIKRAIADSRLDARRNQSKKEKKKSWKKKNTKDTWTFQSLLCSAMIRRMIQYNEYIKHGLILAVQSNIAEAVQCSGSGSCIVRRDKGHGCARCAKGCRSRLFRVCLSSFSPPWIDEDARTLTRRWNLNYVAVHSWHAPLSSLYIWLRTRACNEPGDWCTAQANKPCFSLSFLAKARVYLTWAGNRVTHTPNETFYERTRYLQADERGRELATNESVCNQDINRI